MQNGNFSTSNGKGGGGGSAGGFANGIDDAPGGWAWVGEKGPGLMYVPQHSKIIPNNKINSVDNAEATELTVNIPVTLEGKTLTTVVSTIQLNNTRNRARAIEVSV